MSADARNHLEKLFKSIFFLYNFPKRPYEINRNSKRPNRALGTKANRFKPFLFECLLHVQPTDFAVYSRSDMLWVH